MVCYCEGKFAMTQFLVLWELWMNNSLWMLNTLRPLIILMNNTSLCCPPVPQWYKSIHKLFSYSSVGIGWTNLLGSVWSSEYFTDGTEWFRSHQIPMSKHSAVLMSWINSIKKNKHLAQIPHAVWPLEPRVNPKNTIRTDLHYDMITITNNTILCCCFLHSGELVLCLMSEDWEEW